LRHVLYWGEGSIGSCKDIVFNWRRASKVRRARCWFTSLVASAAIIIVAGAISLSPAQAASRYASIVVDNHTGQVLYARNADAKRYPASLTKIMTLYMLFDGLNSGKITLNSQLKVTAHAAKQPPSKLGLKPGQSIRVVDAIRALVTKSANDVAAVVAENSAGTEARFAKLMTMKAREIGMTRTTFRNASGLPNAHQVTTARDMATLSRRMISDFPDYYGYFRLKYFTYKGHRYRNHNGLLFNYKGTDGIKTGYIRASGFNLAASVRRGPKHLVAVVMGGKTSKSRNQHMQSLLNRTFPKAIAGKQSTPAQRYAAPQLPLRNPMRTHPVALASSAPQHTTTLARTTVRVLRTPGIAAARAQTTVKEQATPLPKVRSEREFHVQVGAYSSQTEAVARLNAVKAKAQNIVAGYDPITLPFAKTKRYLFRARFAGFSRSAAQQTCNQLIRKSISCIVIRAE